MKFKKEKLEEQALEAIKKNDLIFFDDLPAFLPCGRTTLYDRNLNESDPIKSALEKNRLKLKQHLRRQWSESSSPSLQIALYKLLGTSAERAVLNSKPQEAFIDHRANDQRIAREMIEKLFKRKNDS